MSSVIVSNVAPSVTAHKVEEFFAFCGTIDHVKELSKASNGSDRFQVVFTSPKALDTALLLHDAELDGQAIDVKEEKLPEYREVSGQKVDDNKVQSGVTSTGDSQYDDISQEEKPKLAILAQLLASGYKLSDDLIDRAITIDKNQGISSKFKSFLSDLDSKYLHTQDPQSSTSKNLNKAQGQFSSLADTFSSLTYLQKLHHYFDKASATPYGVKINQFYEQVAREVKDVHAEATRLYNLKKADEETSTGAPTTVSGAVPEKS